MAYTSPYYLHTMWVLCALRPCVNSCTLYAIYRIIAPIDRSAISLLKGDTLLYTLDQQLSSTFFTFMQKSFTAGSGTTQSHSCHVLHRGRISLDFRHCLWYDLFKSRSLAAAVSDFSVGQRRSLLLTRGFRLPLFPTFIPPQFKYRTL